MCMFWLGSPIVRCVLTVICLIVSAIFKMSNYHRPKEKERSFKHLKILNSTIKDEMKAFQDSCAEFSYLGSKQSIILINYMTDYICLRWNFISPVSGESKSRTLLRQSSRKGLIKIMSKMFVTLLNFGNYTISNSE